MGSYYRWYDDLNQPFFNILNFNKEAEFDSFDVVNYNK